MLLTVRQPTSIGIRSERTAYADFLAGKLIEASRERRITLNYASMELEYIHVAISRENRSDLHLAPCFGLASATFNSFLSTLSSSVFLYMR